MGGTVLGDFRACGTSKSHAIGGRGEDLFSGNRRLLLAQLLKPENVRTVPVGANESLTLVVCWASKRTPATNIRKDLEGFGESRTPHFFVTDLAVGQAAAMGIEGQ